MFAKFSFGENRPSHPFRFIRTVSLPPRMQSLTKASFGLGANFQSTCGKSRKNIFAILVGNHFYSRDLSRKYIKKAYCEKDFHYGQYHLHTGFRFVRMVRLGWILVDSGTFFHPHFHWNQRHGSNKTHALAQFPDSRPFALADGSHASEVVPVLCGK